MKYSGRLTREQFLFEEGRIVARLLLDDFSPMDVMNKVLSQNLFQYPTEKMVGNIVSVCLNRIEYLGNVNLIHSLAYGDYETAKQVHFYSLVKKEALLRDFMFQIIAEKYRHKELSFSKSDINQFFQSIQEQDDHVAAWSDNTIQKIKQIIIKMLVEVGYLDNIKSTTLNEILLDYDLERGIIDNGDEIYLPIFNRFVK